MKNKRSHPQPSNLNVRVVDAIYTPSPVPRYQGNRPIEALPALQENDVWRGRLQCLPEFNPDERSLSPELRQHCVMAMKNVFVVQSRHLEIREKLDLLLRTAYVGVSMGESKRRHRAQQWYECVQTGKVPTFGDEGQASGEFFSIIGSSGMGKSWAFQRFQEWVPDVIRHMDGQHLQIPIIYVQCPHNGSTKDFARGILRAFDRLLGTSFDSENNRATEETLIAVASALMDRYFVGLLVIDEIQNLSHRKSGGREEFLDFFLQLFNVLHLSIVVIGTMKAASVLQTTFRQARRASSMGTVVWERFKPTEKGWSRLVKGLWDYQWLPEPTPLSEDIIDTLYKETQGITALLVRLLILVQHRAITLGLTTISPALISKVAGDNFVILRPMLNALRSGNPARIALYDDFLIPELDAFPEISGVFPRESLAATESADGVAAKKANSRRTVLNSLLDLGVSTKVAEFHLNAILDITPDAEPMALMNEVLSRIAGKPPLKSPRKTKRQSAPELPTGYDAVKKAGWLPPEGGLDASDGTEEKS